MKIARRCSMGWRFVALVARWITLIGLITGIALATLPALGRDLDGRYKSSPLHDWFEHLARPLLLVCRRVCCRRRRLGSQGWSLSRARAGGGRLQRHGLGRCAGRGRHCRAEQGRADHGLAALWLPSCIDPVLHAGEHDLDGQLHRRGDIRAGSCCCDGG